MRLWITHLLSTLQLMCFYNYVYIKIKIKLFPWKKYFLFLYLCKREINHTMNLLLIFKILKHQHHWVVFLQHHHPKQKNHELIFFNKFEGTCSKFCGFFNQVHLVIQFHLHNYPNVIIQFQFIGMFLGTTLMWFSPLLKC